MSMIRRLRKAIKDPKKAAWFLIIKINNTLIDMKTHKSYVSSDLKELNEIKERSTALTDMSSHVETLFIESLAVKPKLIVELGIRTGESTFVLERVAKLCRSKLVSVDIEDCSHISSYKEWLFIQKDDIEFAKKFENWCKINRIEPKIDILFIDTSHLFEHTLQEIKFWFPLLSNRSKVFFHDTNLKKVYRRKDGSMGTTHGFYNERGVIRALDKYFNKSFNEKENFVDFRNGWLIKHHSYCSGFTILEKICPLVNDLPATS
ncbi:cephalosporin hydroxylase [bacterium BMS3Abin04]|nr:cephalosporin hydroxylase [bacterium BMS3Abin04]